MGCHIFHPMRSKDGASLERREHLRESEVGSAEGAGHTGSSFRWVKGGTVAGGDQRVPGGGAKP